MTTMLVANDGGHIVQLRSLADRFEGIDDRLWVTVPTEQTESLLAGERVHWVGEAPTRDWRAALANAKRVRPLFAQRRIDRAISTGSSLALSALPQAAARRIPAHYIESVTRTAGLSLSGKVLDRVPGVSLYVQWPHLATGRRRFSGSVLDGFRSESRASGPVNRMVVSLGTSGRYGFRRLIERLRAVIPPDVEVLWQTGSTDVSGLDLDGVASVPAEKLAAAIERADVTVAHAGAGIVLTALRAGRMPVIAPRLAAYGEHVDDHQTEIAGHLDRLGLALVSDADDISWDLLRSAASRSIRSVAPVEPFRLRERRSSRVTEPNPTAMQEPPTNR